MFILRYRSNGYRGRARNRELVTTCDYDAGRRISRNLVLKKAPLRVGSDAIGPGGGTQPDEALLQRGARDSPVGDA